MDYDNTTEHFKGGAIRMRCVAGTSKPCRYDLISPVGLRRLAETYGEGSLKYGDRNWEKGIPNSNLLNHLIAHIQQYMRGDTIEDHLAHAAWGLFALMHFEENIKVPFVEPKNIRSYQVELTSNACRLEEKP